MCSDVEIKDESYGEEYNLLIIVCEMNGLNGGGV